jgi:hypothetical protein
MKFLHKYLETVLCVAVLGPLVACAGCKVTANDVEYWKGTAKGPGKIVAVMLADKYDIPLRTQAAMALVEMERQDVDGLTELQKALQRLEAGDRVQIVSGMVPLLEQMMKRPATSPQTDPNATTPPHQIRAKDSAFLVISAADQQSRDRLTKDVINWYVEDFETRSIAGNYSAEQIVRALGSPAATVLVEALNAKLPQQALIKLSELIGQLGNASAKQKAALRIVQIEKEMEGDAFLLWLQDEIKKQLDSKKATEPGYLTKMAAINRQKFIIEGALPAMKHLANQKEVSDRLVEIASTAGDDNQTDRRVTALQALEGNAIKAHLQQLLALALDPKNPVPVRDYAFDRVGDIRSTEAIAPMWPLVEDAKEPRLRWRAGELVLAIGGNGVLAQFFSKLPSGDKVEYQPEELEGYASRMSQMNPLPVAVAKAQLGSPDWWDRVIALDFLSRRGTKTDFPLVENLTHDTASVQGKGWEKDDTVGSVAKRALASMKDRLAETSSQPAASASK